MMKTWTLVWFLISPTNDAGQVEWEAGQLTDLTQAQCEAELEENDLQYLLLTREGLLAGHEIYCIDEDKK
jgi:hypothetical protein